MGLKPTWSVALVEHEKALLRQTMAETLDRAGSEAVLRLLSERVAMLAGEFTPALQARRFVHVVALIAWHEQTLA